MPKALDELPKSTRGGRGTKYDWDEWLGDGKPMLFVKGEDYTCKTSSFIGAARSHFDDEARKVKSVTPPDAEKDKDGDADRVALQVVDA